MQTVKLEYSVYEDDELTLAEYRRQFSACVRSAYSRLKEGFSDKETYNYIKSLNNVDLIRSCSLNSVLYKAHCIIEYEEGFEKVLSKQDDNILRTIKTIEDGTLCASTRKLSSLKRKHNAIMSRKKAYVFGGKGIFKALQKGKITKEEFLEKRIGCYEIYGAKENHGNPQFAIASFKSAVIFKPCRQIKIFMTLKNLSLRQREILDKLYEHQLAGDIAITYRLNKTHIFISFDEKTLYGIMRKDKKKNRVIAIDQNPNYIGCSIVDWKDDCRYKIIASGVISVKTLNDKSFDCSKQQRHYFTNKRINEHYNIVKKLVALGVYYKCEVFGIEKLNFFASRDTMKGMRLNKLVNQMWNRNRFNCSLKAHCRIKDFVFVEAEAQYSSKFGNVLYRKHRLPDMVNASIEIGRRSVEYKKQYIEKTAEISHTIIHPDLTRFGDVLAESMEEFGITEKCKDLYELFGVLAKRQKNSESLYRVPLESTNPKWFKSSSTKSLVFHCEYGNQNDELTSKGSVSSSKMRNRIVNAPQSASSTSDDRFIVQTTQTRCNPLLTRV